MNILKIFLCLLGAVITAVMAGDLGRDTRCYHGGLIFSNMRDEHNQNGNIDNAIVDFCTNVVPVASMDVGQEVHHCYPYPKDNPNGANHVDLYVMNKAYTKQIATAEECIYVMKYIYNRCWKGGWNEYNGFAFTIDPNHGRC